MSVSMLRGPDHSTSYPHQECWFNTSVLLSESRSKLAVVPQRAASTRVNKNNVVEQPTK